MNNLTINSNVAVYNSYSEILQKHYAGKAYITSAEGILKLVSIVVSLLSSAVFVVSDICISYRVLTIIFPILTVISAVLTCVAYVGTLAGCKYYQEMWLYFNIGLSTAAGIIMLVMGVLSLTACSPSANLHFIPGSFAILTSVLVISSVAVTYISSNKLWNKSIRSIDINPT